MNITRSSSIKFDIIPKPGSTLECELKLKGSKDRIKVNIDLIIYCKNPNHWHMTDVISSGVQSVYTSKEDSIHIIKLKVPDFKTRIQSFVNITVDDIRPASVEHLIIEDEIEREEKRRKKEEEIRARIERFKIKINKIKIGEEKPDIICEGLMFGHSGFAKAMRNVAFGLDKIGCNIRTIVLDGDNIGSLSTEKGKRVNELVIQRENASISEISFWITMNNPMGVGIHENFYSIAYVMFETENFPLMYAEHLKKQNEVWAPSNFCRESMIRSGLSNVIVMPLGVDTEMFNPERVEAMECPIDLKDKFKFLTVCGYSERKGISILVRAFAEEFNKNDNIALYIKGGWYDPIKAQNEINDTIKDIQNPPYIHLDFNIYPDETLAKIYKMCDAFVLPTRGEGWCLLPNSPILTLDRGIQKIRDIKIGDKVLTHRGRFMRVSNVLKREYSGDMIKIIPYRLKIPIILTPEHKVLAIKTELCRNKSGNNKDNRICKPGLECYYIKDGRQYKYCKYVSGEEPYKKYKTEWLNTSDLKVGDFVTYPRINNKNIDIEKIRILDYIDDFLNVTGDNYEDGTKQTDMFGCFVEKTIAMNNPYSIKNNKIPAYIKVNEDLMLLFGYFIAEGDISGDRQLEFSFNINEYGYLKDVEKLMKDIFGSECEHVLKEDNNVHVLRYSNKVLSSMFQNMFCPKEYIEKKGKGSKANIVRIPAEFLNLPLKKLAGLIKGIWKGDGGDAGGYHGYGIKTTSDTLAHQLLYILSRFGILAAIKKTDKKGNRHESYVIDITGRDVHIFHNIVEERCTNLENIGKEDALYLKGKNLFYIQIRDIEIIKYSGDVWNLDVEEDNSYVSSIIVHNCLPAIEAMSMELPAICTRYGGQLEFMNDDNSYLINIDGVGPEPRCDWICHEYIGGRFAIPNKDHLRQLMRYIYENKEDAKIKGKYAREYIINNFSWEKSCNRMYKRLINITYELYNRIDN